MAAQWLGGDVGRHLSDGDRQLLPRMLATWRRVPAAVDAEEGELGSRARRKKRSYAEPVDRRGMVRW